MTISFEPLSADWRDDPYSVFAQLRREDPIHYAPVAKAYCVSRYDDVVQVLRTPEVFSSKAMGTELMSTNFGGMGLRDVPQVLRFLWQARINPLNPAQPDALISIDAPRHEELRSIVNRGFTPRRIAAWEERVAENLCLINLIFKTVSTTGCRIVPS